MGSYLVEEEVSALKLLVLISLIDLPKNLRNLNLIKLIIEIGLIKIMKFQL